MRKILCDGVQAVHESSDIRETLRIFLLGPSDRENSVFAKERVVEIETVDGQKFLVPLSVLSHMLLRVLQVPIWDAINKYTEACGGNTGAATVGDDRMNAVVAVEKALRGD